MRDSILIVTDSKEPNVPAVREYLLQEKVFQLNVDCVLNSLFSMEIDKGEITFKIDDGDSVLSLEQTKSIWYRRPPQVVFPEAVFSEEAQKFAEKEFQRFLMATWHSCSESDILWVNNPLDLRRMELNKPLQLRTAKQMGFSIPKTLITNDIVEARKFAQDCDGAIVFKTCGSSCVTGDTGELMAVFTNPISSNDLDKFAEDLKYAPVIFQDYIAKKLELRITVVGNRLFTCAIYSQDSLVTKDDWRHYDLDRVRHEIYQLPKEVEEKIFKCMRSWNLQFGAIDMILTPEDDYVFLEVNPSGQWGWIEALTGMPICKSLAELLSEPDRYVL